MIEFSCKKCVFLKNMDLHGKEDFMKKFDSCEFVVANFFYVNSPSWQYAKRRPESLHNIIFVTEGTLYMELEDKRYVINKNEFLFMPHGSKSRGYRASDKPTAFYHIIFSSDAALDFEPHFSINNTENIRTLYALLNDISKIKDYSQDAKNAILRSLLYEISYQQFHKDTQISPDTVPIVELMKKYIKDNLHRSLTVEDIGHHFGFSGKHANRMFYSVEHTTVKAYFNTQKIKRIEEYLMSTNLSIGELAKKLGFPNTDALHKYYKYHTDRTIKEFRSKFIN